MLKTWKKAVSLVLVLALSFVLCVPTFAEENNIKNTLAITSDEKDSAEELLGSAISEYNTEANLYGHVNQDAANIKDIIVSNDQVVLEYNGESKFIDVIGELKSGKYIDITNDAVWYSNNPDIVFADGGRILAVGSGNATVTVEYAQHKKIINVIVLENLNIAKEVEKIEATQGLITLNGFSSSDREDVISNAEGMVNLEWKPTKNVRGWKNKITFNANTKYTGIPYSQTAYQKDESGFNNALKGSDFYNNYTRFGIIMPKYGNDCSGFLSFAWGISRTTTSGFVAGIKDGTYTKVGSYNASNPSKTDLKAAYKKLQAADAVVKNGHTFLIASNDTSNSKIYAYEQTPYKAQYTSWTYDSMANGGYMPFTKE